MRTASEINKQAFELTKENLSSVIIFTFIWYVIAYVVGMVGGATLIGIIPAMLAGLVVNYGLYIGFLYLTRGQEMENELLWRYLRDKRIWTTESLRALYGCLWSLLFIVPGFIKYLYSYGMTPYILNDEPELSNNAAIEKSMAMMQGHKMDLFILDLPYIGINLITFGLAGIITMPVNYIARAQFYNELKAEA